MSNRKAVKKCPYVIHIDGTGKARGIHKRQWRAAIRGQCSRLDPSMDNINHHPKAVVDSLWHALEKEWEFEGYGHRAREMFEKAATKFMRNRKMQLKYKYKKIVNDTKPDDVNATYWSKIVDLTKKSSKHPMSSGSSGLKLKEKERSPEGVREKDFTIQLQESEKYMQRMNPNHLKTAHDVLSHENEDVETTIEKLKRELLRLQNSRKVHLNKAKKVKELDLTLSSKNGSMVVFDTVSNGTKENNMLRSVNNQSQSLMRYGATSKTPKVLLQGKSVSQLETYLSRPMTGEGGNKLVGASGEGENEIEMECGDVVAMLAIIGGIKEEIGKAILMGFSGSKFVRKVIPKGWCSVKVISYTDSGGCEICPFPAGWKDQVQQKTVKDREGETIMWPESLLHC